MKKYPCVLALGVLISTAVACSKKEGSGGGLTASPSVLEAADYQENGSVDLAANSSVGVQIRVQKQIVFGEDIVRVQFILERDLSQKIHYDRNVPGNGYQDRPYVMAQQTKLDVASCEVRRKLGSNLKVGRAEFESPIVSNQRIFGLALLEKAEAVVLPAGGVLTLKELESGRAWMIDEKNGFTIFCDEVIAAKATCSATSAANDEACTGTSVRKLNARGVNKILKGFMEL